MQVFKTEKFQAQRSESAKHREHTEEVHDDGG